VITIGVLVAVGLGLVVDVAVGTSESVNGVGVCSAGGGVTEGNGVRVGLIGVGNRTIGVRVAVGEDVRVTVGTDVQVAVGIGVWVAVGMGVQVAVGVCV